MDENEKYRELFFEEADEHLENLNDGVLELENDPENEETIDSIFRSAHTLKGMAATMGYETMAKLTHRMENVFQLFKNKVVEVNSDSISLIFDCLDSLSEIIESLRSETDFQDEEIASLMKKLEEIENKEFEKKIVVENKGDVTLKEIRFPSELLTTEDVQLMNDLENTEYTPFAVSIRLDKECTLKAPRVYLILDKLNEVGEITFSYPDTETLEKGEFDRDFHIVLITEKNIEEVEKNIQSNSDIDSISILSPEETFNKQLLPETKKTTTEIKTAKKEKSKNIPKHGQQSIKVDLIKLDTFMNLVSELVVYRTRLENISMNDTKHDIKEPLTEVARITSELQDLVLKIRMQQVSVVMNRFPRVVRDLAKDLDKDMILVIEGEDTELDRTVVSELSEPLVHLIRNSADHGIESRARRKELGKPVEGEIKISAFQQGNRVTITVSDDGKGINPDIIKKSAEKKGISTEGMSDKEIIHLIFHPGFSTAQEVTNVSGRGVGMDVVQSKISQLGGTIELQSEVNMGSIFTINLPLTLSIIQSLMVEVSGELFALPQSSIEKVFEVSEKDIVKVHTKEVFMYQDIAIPVIRLQESLQLKKNEIENAHPHLIIVLLGKNYYAFLVDDLIGQQEIVIKKLGKELKHLNKFLGATILGNGDITLIIDINVICSEGSVKTV
ncbi:MULTISPECIES: chemotaxis protein CheA [Vagococcus]|uniref:Chemotaxis protein CheA n=1 Tax=Vagococcus fluvialis bH819 TaxID=1255619 RepID=A0A1X6WRI2_9ENTE|nr:MULTISPECIES: chemotaxis protein CheA [Vagococcus]SLM86904.1 Signal transduction histidine kinase CheA [Vagococcus fluvialis bH819]HCM88639.1 chemotaxis protein CheA [Vagococcus sp.]